MVHGALIDVTLWVAHFVPHSGLVVIVWWQPFKLRCRRHGSKDGPGKHTRQRRHRLPHAAA